MLRLLHGFSYGLVGVIMFSWGSGVSVNMSVAISYTPWLTW